MNYLFRMNNLFRMNALFRREATKTQNNYLKSTNTATLTQAPQLLSEYRACLSYFLHHIDISAAFCLSM